GGPRDWPEPIGRWFRAGSSKFARLGLAAEGTIFDRLPALYHFSAVNQPRGCSFDFHLLPVDLLGMTKGSARRRLATLILEAAVYEMVRHHNTERDWVIGGDFNAELATPDFTHLTVGGMVPLFAND